MSNLSKKVKTAAASQPPAPQKIEGAWRILEMELWDKDFIDMEGPGKILFKKKGSGEMRFGCVQVELDWEFNADAGRAEFTFSGFDEMTEVSGRGWAKADGGKLIGRVFFHQGDNSGFKAKRAP